VFMLATNDRLQTLEEIKSRLEARFGEQFPAPSLSAFLRHLRKEQFGSFILEKRRQGDPRKGLWAYRLLPPRPQAVTQLDLIAEARA
ncbi:MAG: hypothetical protein WAU89_02170, partial [Candidatus Acidiferrales bacterium]